MARGFASGLIHGGLAGAAALAALSLAMPLPEEAGREGAPVVAPAEVAPEVVAPAPTPKVESVPAPTPEAAPQADAVNLPVGSEFGRGADLAPPTPAIPEPPGAAMTEAPAVVAPAAEPAPVASARPEAIPDPIAGAPASATLSAPEVAEADDAPAARLTETRAPAGPTGPAALALPEDAADAAPRPISPAPAANLSSPDLPQPGLDLSTPPDLTDLRAIPQD